MGIPISELPVAESVSNSDIFPIVQNGITKQAVWSAASIDLLWENPDPTLEFVAQDVVVANAQGYDLFMFVSTVSTTNSAVVPASFAPSTTAARIYSIFNNSIVVRAVSMVFVTLNNAIGFQFGDASYLVSYNPAVSDTEIKNTTNIPYQIYGIKGV